MKGLSKMHIILVIIMSTANICNSVITKSFGPRKMVTRLKSHGCIDAYMSPARPSLDDVERISKGLAAKKRGVGSRQVPHRLNEDERKEWDLSKKRKFLILRGTGYRRERGDAPLANIYRNLCDAKAIPCISIVKKLGISITSGGNAAENQTLEDIVTVDFSTLRTTEIKHLVKLCLSKCSTNEHISFSGDETDTADIKRENGDSQILPEAVYNFTSITSIHDFSDLSAILGWSVNNGSNKLNKTKIVDDILFPDNTDSDSSDISRKPYDLDFDSDPIWRIPVYGLQVKFSSRSESKLYAEMIANELIN